MGWWGARINTSVTDTPKWPQQWSIFASNATKVAKLMDNINKQSCGSLQPSVEPPDPFKANWVLMYVLHAQETSPRSRVMNCWQWQTHDSLVYCY